MILNKIFIVILLLLTNCGPKIKNFVEYKKQPILKQNLILRQDSSIKKDIKKTKLNIIVAEFSNQDNKIAEKINLGHTMEVATENILSNIKSIKIIDRNIFKNLSEEIKLAEMQDDYSYEGPVSADYIISGDVAAIGFNHQFIKEKIIYNPISKKFVKIPAKNRYIADFNGNLKIYKMPSLEIIDIIELSEEMAREEDAIVNQSFFSKKIDTSVIDQNDDNMLRQLVVKSINNQSHLLKKIFSSLRRGYILEKKSDGKNYIFKINLGQDQGIKYKQKIKIFTKMEDANPLTEEKIIEEIYLGSGIVTNIINKNSSWIMVKNKNLVNNIKIGDHIIIDFHRSKMNYIPKKDIDKWFTKFMTLFP